MDDFSVKPLLDLEGELYMVHVAFLEFYNSSFKKNKGSNSFQTYTTRNGEDAETNWKLIEIID